MQETGTNLQKDEDDDSAATWDNNDLVAHANLMSSNGWEEIPQDSFTVLPISKEFEIRNSVGVQEEELIGHIMNLKT